MNARGPRQRLARLLPDVAAWWWLAALIVVLLATAGLAAWALASTNARPVTQGAVPIEYFSADDEPAVDPVDYAVPPRQLIALDADTAWRTLASTCPADVAVVERTTDGGQSWSAAALTGSATVIALQPGTAVKVSALVASSEDCSLRYRSSVDGGASWAAAIDRIPALDLLDPLDPTIVRLGDTQVTAPCLDPAELIVLPGGHALRCASGIVFTLDGETSEWQQQALPGPALAILHDGDGLVGLIPSMAGCDAGVAVLAPGAVPIYGEPEEPADGPTPAPSDAPEELPVIGYEDELRACLDIDPSAPIAATTAGDGTLWLWVGEAVARSTDGGTTWSGLE